MENKATYEVSSELVVNRSFSMSLRHVGMITDLAQRLGCKDSAVIRLAIEKLYENMQASDKPAEN